MSKIKFYTVFSILNILLILYILGSFFVVFFLMFYDLFSTPDILFYSGIIAYIFLAIIKLLLLPKIFVKIAKKYENSIIGEFTQHLCHNPQEKWKILLLAFCFDIPYVLYRLDFNDLMTLVLIPVIYMLLYGGGVFLFYVMLYMELGKLKVHKKSNVKFYATFSILNILIILFLIGSFFITVKLIMNKSDTITGFICGVTYLIIYIILKYCLPKIFVKIAKKYENSMIGEFTQHLCHNPQEKKKILLSAFCFDIPFLVLLFVAAPSLKTLVGLLLAYLTLYGGGVFLFYIMLYKELKIKPGK